MFFGSMHLQMGYNQTELKYRKMANSGNPTPFKGSVSAEIK